MRATPHRVPAPGTREQRKRVAKGLSASPTAGAIREAATYLFAEHGYEMTTMKAIADRVGLQPSAIYNHFESKQALLRDIAQGTIRSLIDDAHAAIESFSDPGEQLMRATRAHIRMHTDQRYRAHVANREIPSLEEPARSEQIVLRQEYVNIYERMIVRGLRVGAFSGVRAPRITAYAILQMGIGVSTWFHEDGPLSAGEVADLYAEMALRMVGHASETARDENRLSPPSPLGAAPT